MQAKLILASSLLFYSALVFGQPGVVRDDGIASSIHRKNVGKVTFMASPIPLQAYTEKDFLSTYALKDTGDLNIRVFMRESLVNALHRMAPEVPAETLAQKGNFQFAFFVDDKLIYKENLHAGAGTADSKQLRTVFRVPLQSSTNEDSWGRFLWDRFLLRGGDDALISGTHRLKLEIRPYLRLPDIKVGDVIASGNLMINVVKPHVDERQVAVQPRAPGSGWTLSTYAYDTDKLRELNLRIGERTFKDITSIVVIREGQLLIEQYFNGASRQTLHDTRSVGKTFASTLLGIAIEDGHIKDVEQTLGDFYDLARFANVSSEKRRITLRQLLTMSAPFAGSDSDEASPGHEEKMYPTGDWVRFVLDLPLDPVKTITRTWDYFTGGVVLLGDILHRSVPDGLENYANEKLFAPLGIQTFKWQYTPQNIPNTAGGLQLRSLDLAKYGQVYRDRGRWQDKQIIPEGWVEQSLTRQIALPESDNEYYGYLFWNKTYVIGNQRHEAFYASGNGGNRIFIFKDQPLVVVVTSVAYNKPYGHAQADKIVERYLLPAVLN